MLRQKWQGEKQALLHHLNEEEEHVKRLLSAIEHEKEHSKKVGKFDFKMWHSCYTYYCQSLCLLR